MSDWTAEQLDALTERLSAYLDGEADAAEVRELTALLETDATARRILEELHAMQSRVSALPKVAAPPALSDRVLAAIEREELLEGAPFVDAAEPSHGRRWLQLLASAALVALAVGVGYYAFFLVVEPTAAPKPLEDTFASSKEIQPGAAPSIIAMSRSAKPETETAAAPPASAGELASGDASAPSSTSKDDLERGDMRVASRDEADTIRQISPAAPASPLAIVGGERAAPAGREESADAAGIAGDKQDVFENAVRSRAQSAAGGYLQQQAQRPNAFSNQLNIQPQDPETQRELNARLPALLTQNSIVAESTLSPERQASPTQSLYFAEDAGGRQQVLVRANLSEVNALLSDVQSAFPDVEMQAISNEAGIVFSPAVTQREVADGALKMLADESLRQDDDKVMDTGQANQKIRLPSPEEQARTQRAAQRSAGNAPTTSPRPVQLQALGELSADPPVLLMLNIAPPPQSTQPATSPADDRRWSPGTPNG